MGWATSITLGVGLVFALIFSGAPIFLAFLVVTVVGISTVIGPAAFGMFANSLYEATTTTSLASVPLFILMGEILFRSGTIDVLLDSVDKLVGRIRGRQFTLVIALSALFGALSGSAMAVAAMMGRSLMPGMKLRGYDQQLSAGTILAGSTLAPIIPPSLLAILIGTLADVSIGRLLIAGVGPGLLMAVLFQVYITFKLRSDPELVPSMGSDEGPGATLVDRLVAIVRMSPFLIIIVSVMGMILLGIATPSESAATGVVGALVTAAIYRRLNGRMLLDSFSSTVSISAMILAIMMTSKMFTQLLAFTGSTTALVTAATSLDLGWLGMLLVMMVVPFFLCMFIDSIAVMLVVIPIYKPIISAMGYDPIWFWLLFLINVSLGGITPPFGYTIFSFKAVVGDLSMQKVFASCWPFVFIYLIGMAIIIGVPGIATWLPQYL